MTELETQHSGFLLLRHGQSVANVRKLIVSKPETGVTNFGLTPTGIQQVKDTCSQRTELGRVRRIVSSDFRRALETALIVSKHLGLDVQTDERLRERFFGEFEGTNNSNYEKVWREDARDATHQQWGVESVESVAERMTEFVQQTKVPDDGSVLIVSHGDPLQILQTARCGWNLSDHRRWPKIDTAALSRLGAA